MQGVWFRAHTLEKARELGISGYVMNLPSGQVFIEAEGEAGPLEAFVAWCRLGPPRARVSGVEIKTGEPKGYSGFMIQR